MVILSFPFLGGGRRAMILFSPFIRRRVSCDGDRGPTRTQQCRRGHRVVVIGQEQGEGEGDFI